MNRVRQKLAKGLYLYKNVLITFDDERPALGWFFIWDDERQYFALRSQAEHQIDRLLCLDAGAMAQAPSNKQLAAVDLSDYATPDLLIDLQRRLSAQGLGRSTTQLTQAARNGNDGVVKRIMLALVLSRLLGL